MISYLRLIIGIFITIGIFIFLIYIGIKGIIAFLLGILVATYLILSKNPILIALIDMTQSEDFIDKLTESKNKNDK